MEPNSAKNRRFQPPTRKVTRKAEERRLLDEFDPAKIGDRPTYVREQGLQQLPAVCLPGVVMD
jgi:hypothetical protein